MLDLFNVGFVGAAGAGSGEWDVDDEFTYASQGDFDTAYPTSAPAVLRGNPTNDTIYWNFSGATSSNQQFLTHDLMGATIDDTAWVLRQIINPTTVTQATSPFNIGIHFGISSVTTQGGESQDYIGTSAEATSSTTPKYYGYEVDSAGLNLPSTGGGQAFSTTFNTTKYWNEIIRTTATNFTTELFSDEWTTSTELESVTVPSTVINLRYWCNKWYDNANNGQLEGNIDQPLQFADGVTVAP